MTTAIAINPDGTVGGGWGRADRVAIATVTGASITDWTVIEVGWNAAHDEGTEGSHHARIARFLKDNHVDTVIAGHMGDGMVRMMATMGITTVLGVTGDAGNAVTALAKP